VNRALLAIIANNNDNFERIIHIRQINPAIYPDFAMAISGFHRLFCQDFSLQTLAAVSVSMILATKDSSHAPIK
jgi:hypothetical protein